MTFLEDLEFTYSEFVESKCIDCGLDENFNFTYTGARSKWYTFTVFRYYERQDAEQDSRYYDVRVRISVISVILGHLFITFDCEDGIYKKMLVEDIENATLEEVRKELNNEEDFKDYCARREHVLANISKVREIDFKKKLRFYTEINTGLRVYFYELYEREDRVHIINNAKRNYDLLYPTLESEQKELERFRIMLSNVPEEDVCEEIGKGDYDGYFDKKTNQQKIGYLEYRDNLLKGVSGYDKATDFLDIRYYYHPQLLTYEKKEIEKLNGLEKFKDNLINHYKDKLIQNGIDPYSNKDLSYIVGKIFSRHKDTMEKSKIEYLVTLTTLLECIKETGEYKADPKYRELLNELMWADKEGLDQTEASRKEIDKLVQERNSSESYIDKKVIDEKLMNIQYLTKEQKAEMSQRINKVLKNN